MTASDAMIVRVLTGSRAGAETALPSSGRATVGYEYWHDVVIRDASAKGCALEIETGEGVARMTILDGTVEMLGSTLRSGDAAVLPPYVPVRIGDVAFAFGVADSERWTEASSLAATTESDVAVPAEAPAAASLAEGWRSSLSDSGGSRFGRALNSRAVIGVALLIVAAVGAGPAIDALELGGSPAERAERAVHAAGYGSVTVKTAADGGVVVGGYVPTDADRQRVQSLIEAKALRATMSIETGDELARSTADVARMNGVEARTRSLRSGVVEITTAPTEIEARQALERAVRRDVPGLRQLVFREDEGLGEAETVKTIADATKRVSSVVAGDPAYIVTADGARYFPGAILPSGHRLVAITEQTVVLERNNRQLRLKF